MLSVVMVNEIIIKIRGLISMGKIQTNILGVLAWRFI